MNTFLFPTSNNKRKAVSSQSRRKTLNSNQFRTGVLETSCNNSVISSYEKSSAQVFSINQTLFIDNAKTELLEPDTSKST